MKTRNRKKIILFSITCQVIAFSLLFTPTQPIHAQEQQTATPEARSPGVLMGLYRC